MGRAARVIAGCAGCVSVGSAELGMTASASGMVRIPAPRWRSSWIDGDAKSSYNADEGWMLNDTWQEFLATSSCRPFRLQM